MVVGEILTPLVASNATEGFERLDCLKVDVGLLQKHVLENVINKYPPIMQSSDFGGWSVYSSDGRYTDGWHKGDKMFQNVNGQAVYDYMTAEKLGMKRTSDYNKPTEICHGYMSEVMMQIEALGFRPSRARISLVVANGATTWHRDAEDKDYGVRLHIPIIANADCFFETTKERYSMPADGSAYLVRVNCMHRAYNLGREPRYHLIMQSWDVQGHSTFQRFDTAKNTYVDSPHV